MRSARASPARHAAHTPHPITRERGHLLAHPPLGRGVGATATTLPQNSWPITIPTGMLGRALRSDPQMPHAVTSSTNSAGPGDGVGDLGDLHLVRFGDDGSAHGTSQFCPSDVGVGRAVRTLAHVVRLAR